MANFNEKLEGLSEYVPTLPPPPTRPHSHSVLDFLASMSLSSDGTDVLTIQPFSQAPRHPSCRTRITALHDFLRSLYLCSSQLFSIACSTSYSNLFSRVYFATLAHPETSRGLLAFQTANGGPNESSRKKAFHGDTLQTLTTPSSPALASFLSSCSSCWVGDEGSKGDQAIELTSATPCASSVSESRTRSMAGSRES